METWTDCLGRTWISCPAMPNRDCRGSCVTKGCDILRQRDLEERLRLFVKATDDDTWPVELTTDLLRLYAIVVIDGVGEVGAGPCSGFASLASQAAVRDRPPTRRDNRR